MRIDENYIESLLYENEGPEFDAKREQYKFIQADDKEKSELLKDILAFSNAWRRSDAFILIGVEDVKGGKSNVVGIPDTELLDDAMLQQFVNSKTNKPIIFEYRNIEFKNKKLGVIHIPQQERPIYLKKNYGKLQKEIVYIRRGSSTDIAKPEEIARMGVQPKSLQAVPDLEAFFCDPKKRVRLENKQKIYSLVLNVPDNSYIPDYKTSPPLNLADPVSRILSTTSNFDSHYDNKNYYRELSLFTKISQLVSPFNLALYNGGTATANDVRVEVNIPKIDGATLVIDADSFPEAPSKKSDHLWNIPNYQTVFDTKDLTVSEFGDIWTVEAKAGKVQPKAYYWFEDPFYLGCTESASILLKLKIFSDELCDPKEQELVIEVEAGHETVSLDEIIEFEHERFKNSPEYKKFLEKMKK